MFATLRVNGEEPAGGAGGILEEDGHVMVEFGGGAPDVQWRCAYCDQVWDEADDSAEDECPDAECTCEDECPDDHIMGECETCETRGLSECDIAMSECERPHKVAKEHVPLGWVNSAGMEFNESGDSVTVSISTGDPRGAFGMTIRRTDDGKLIMHVPHPGEPFAHEELTELHTGTYRVGHHGS